MVSDKDLNSRRPGHIGQYPATLNPALTRRYTVSPCERAASGSTRIHARLWHAKWHVQTACRRPCGSACRQPRRRHLDRTARALRREAAAERCSYAASRVGPTFPRMRQPNFGSGRPGACGLVGGPAEMWVDLAGEVTLEAADDFRFRFSICGAKFDVGAGRRVRAHPGEHDPPQGVAGLPVAAGVEPPRSRPGPLGAPDHADQATGTQARRASRPAGLARVRAGRTA